VIPQIKKVLYNRLSRNRSSKVVDVIKLIGTLQNVPYRHVVIIVIYCITNNIHISYQSAVSRVQDKPFLFLRRIRKNVRKITRRGLRPPNPNPGCAAGRNGLSKKTRTLRNA
jgi:hypothetical protein